jgi:type II secretory pathway pseudopilin PulG
VLHQGDDRGETLVELLMTIVIMGIAVVSIVGGLVTAIQMSDVHRKQATSGAYAQDYAESVARYVAAGNYVPCAGQPPQLDYTAAFASVTMPAAYASQYKPPVATYRYWDPTWTPGSTASPWLSPATPCSVAADPGVQQVTVQVQSKDGRATEQAVVVVRRP